MKRINIYLILILFSGLIISCDDFFEIENREIISDEDAFSSADGATSVLSNIYSRIRDTQGFSTDAMNDWDESVKGGGDDSRADYGSGYRNYWDYGLIRECNLFLQNIEKYGGKILKEQRDYLEGEARFLRAYIYFDLAKNMGGVPLVTEPFEYTPGSSPEIYQKPRAKETEIYDYIASEMDEIKDLMDSRIGNSAVKNRASKGAALALKSRAMLYAASIAKYTPTRSDLTLTLPGEETGIPASKTTEYYEKSLEASKELMAMNLYRLYTGNSDKSENFYEVLIKKNSSNPEVIFVKDYDGENVKNGFTGATIPRSQSTNRASGSAVNPTLNLVESFQKADGSSASFVTRISGDESYGNADVTTLTNDYVVYDNPEDIFAGREPRLYGTVLTPGMRFKGAPVELWAGLAVWNGNGYDIKKVDNMDDLLTDNNDKKMYNGLYMTGLDGPHAVSGACTRSGFLLKKYVDNKAGSEVLSQSDIAWVRFRYAEILLNAAEAAYELGYKDDALKYINEIRERAGGAGFKLTSLTSIDQIRHERRIELAFEDHRYYDLKRWRIADKLFDGSTNTSSAVAHGLWPYKIYRPGHESDGKFIFRRVIAPKKFNPYKFMPSNYYASLNSDWLSHNKLLVKNPYQQ